MKCILLVYILWVKIDLSLKTYFHLSYCNLPKDSALTYSKRELVNYVFGEKKIDVYCNHYAQHCVNKIVF